MKVGSIVKCKVGGPEMVISNVEGVFNKTYKCTWFSVDKNSSWFDSCYFREEALILVKE